MWTTLLNTEIYAEVVVALKTTGQIVALSFCGICVLILYLSCRFLEVDIWEMKSTEWGWQINGILEEEKRWWVIVTESLRLTGLVQLQSCQSVGS